MRTRATWSFCSDTFTLSRRVAPFFQSSIKSLSSSQRRKPSSPSRPISYSPDSGAISWPTQRAEKLLMLVSRAGSC